MSNVTELEKKIRNKHVAGLAELVQLRLQRANEKCEAEESEGLPGEAAKDDCEIQYHVLGEKLREVLRFGQTFQSAALNTVENLWKRAHALESRLFVSDEISMLPSFHITEGLQNLGKPIQFNTFIYLIPNMPVYDIAEFVEFGTKNLSNPERRWGEARDSLKSAQARWGFEIISAYKSLLIGRFVKPLSNKSLMRELHEMLPYSELDFDESISKTGFRIWRD